MRQSHQTGANSEVPTYPYMLLWAHGIAALANVGNVTPYQGNPLAINRVEWIALFRYLIPTLRYWGFDRHAVRIEHLEPFRKSDSELFGLKPSATLVRRLWRQCRSASLSWKRLASGGQTSA